MEALYTSVALASAGVSFSSSHILTFESDDF